MEEANKMQALLDSEASAAGAIPSETPAGERVLHVERPRRRSWPALGIAFLGAGVNHFVMPRAYERIVPPSLKSRSHDVVAISGVAEIVGGLGVLLPWTRRPAGLGLIALLVAVFPANLYMARSPEEFRRIPRWALYARLPLQPLMMWWAWSATRRRPSASR
jgi:uncharacterized membrane protein